MVTCILWADLMTSFSQLGLYLTDVLGNISFVKYQSWCMYLAKAIHILFCCLKIMLILYLSARSCNVVQFANGTSLFVVRKLAFILTFPGTVLVHLR